eukprot:COSAG06_NODE_1972_length_7938_cov_4.377216_5_plen_105_part_00
MQPTAPRDVAQTVTVSARVEEVAAVERGQSGWLERSVRFELQLRVLCCVAQHDQGVGWHQLERLQDTLVRAQGLAGPILPKREQLKALHETTRARRQQKRLNRG